jgi:type II secretory pathway pseudopilin PulG
MVRRHRIGLTLLELLTVVALLAILASLMFPVVVAARDAGRRSRCLTNLRHLALAHRMYADDQDGVLLPWQFLGPQGPVVWPELLQPYMHAAGILDDGFHRQTKWPGTQWQADYALCSWGPGGKGTANAPYWRWPGAPAGRPGRSQGMTLAEVLRPAEVLQMTDGLTTRYPRSWGQCWILSRHRAGWLIGVFVDGHARVVTPAAWEQVDRDRLGFYFPIASADRPAP